MYRNLPTQSLLLEPKLRGALELPIPFVKRAQRLFRIPKILLCCGYATFDEPSTLPRGTLACVNVEICEAVQEELQNVARRRWVWGFYGYTDDVGARVNTERYAIAKRSDSVIQAQFGRRADHSVQRVHTDAITTLGFKNLGGEDITQNLATPQQVGVKPWRAAGFGAEVHTKLRGKARQASREPRGDSALRDERCRRRVGRAHEKDSNGRYHRGCEWYTEHQATSAN